MFHTVLLSTIFWVTISHAISDIYFPHNASRVKPAPSGIAEYRSALTLDWLAAEDSRQRELAGVYETEASAPVQVLVSDCISYSKPASGKVARLMLELLKNLEGDDGNLISELIQALIRSKLLVETSMLEAEPDLDSLVKTPAVMMGEPHATFPRILAMIWMAATDPSTVKKNGWCSVSKVAKYLTVTKSMLIAKHMRNLDPVVARARFVMEEFIQHVTPNMYGKDLKVVRTTPFHDFHQKDLRKPSYKIKPTRVQPLIPKLELSKTTRSFITVDHASIREEELNFPHSAVIPASDHNDDALINLDLNPKLKNEAGYKTKFKMLVLLSFFTATCF